MAELDAPDSFPAWGHLVRAHARVMRFLEEEMEEELGIPLGYYLVLRSLVRAPERRLRMQDLAGLVLLSNSGVSRLIDRMEDDALVRRQYASEDGRVVYACLTKRGENLSRRADKVHLRGVRQHFAARLSPEELRTLEDALKRVAEAAEARRRTAHPTSSD